MSLLTKKQRKCVSHDYVKHWLGEMKWKLEIEWENKL